LQSFSPKNVFFLKRNFPMKCFENFIYCIYSCPNMSYVFLQSNLEKYEFLKMHRFCVSSWKFVIISNHTLTFSSLFFYVINYKISLNNIHIPSHLHVEKDSWTSFLTLIFYKQKMEKIWKYKCFLDVFNSTLLPLKFWGWNKFYFEN
jgi:hypothetical protein